MLSPSSAVALLAAFACVAASPLAPRDVPSIRAEPSRLLARQSSSSTSAPSVILKNGTLAGRSEPGLKQELFLNIPYAQPPIGDLRLANPQPVNQSYSTSPRDASQWGNICPGSGISSTSNVTLGQPYTLDEDCLNINLIRPEGTKEGDELPFGGGFIQGTANDPRYNGSYLVQRSVSLGQPIIFASINYRLSGFGFPAGQAAADAGVLNLGLKDQRLALHWMQENVGKFGGNPKKVTIFGQSAGGVSVTSQMVAYGGRDDSLFSGAIINSGVFATQNSSLASQNQAWSNFLNATSCTSTDSTLACLRALPYDTYYSGLLNSSYNPAPIPDGDFLTQSNVNAINQGKVVKKPVLIGATRDEATSGIGAPIGVNNDTAFRAAMSRSFSTLLYSNTNFSLDRLAELYPNDNEAGCPFFTGDGVAASGLQDKRSNAVLTDSIHGASRFMAQRHSAAVSTWSYRFHQVPENQTIELGVSHANELPYIFGVQNRTIRTPLGYRAGDEDTSRRMQTYIINFVVNEDPNKGSADSDLLYWPRYDEGQKNLIVQNNKTRVEKDDYRAEGQEFLVQLATGQT